MIFANYPNIREYFRKTTKLIQTHFNFSLSLKVRTGDSDVNCILSISCILVNGAMTLDIMTFSIMTFSIATLSNCDTQPMGTQHNDTNYNVLNVIYAECHLCLVSHTIPLCHLNI